VALAFASAHAILTPVMAMLAGILTIGWQAAPGIQTCGIAMGASFTRSRLAWQWVHTASMSVYSHFIARGRDLIFPKNTAMEIAIGTRASTTAPISSKPAMEYDEAVKTSRFIILRRELRFNSSRKNQPARPVQLVDRFFYDVVSRWAVAALFFFTWNALFVAIFLYWVAGSWESDGLYRLLTHRGIRLPSGSSTFSRLRRDRVEGGRFCGWHASYASSIPRSGRRSALSARWQVVGACRLDLSWQCFRQDASTLNATFRPG